MHRAHAVRTRAVTVAGATILSFAMAGSALASPGVSSAGAALAEIRAATARFHDVANALAAGYIPVSPCEERPGVGGMGVHYVNPALASNLAIDAFAPELLLYAPSGDGPRLVGVEYFSVALANTDSGPRPWFGTQAPPLGFFNPAPTVLGQTFNGPMPGHGPSMPWHYDLHVWVWQANPAGTFTPWNPTISC